MISLEWNWTLFPCFFLWSIVGWIIPLITFEFFWMELNYLIMFFQMVFSLPSNVTNTQVIPVRSPCVLTGLSDSIWILDNCSHFPHFISLDSTWLYFSWLLKSVYPWIDWSYLISLEWKWTISMLFLIVYSLFSNVTYTTNNSYQIPICPYEIVWLLLILGHMFTFTSFLLFWILVIFW